MIGMRRIEGVVRGARRLARRRCPALPRLPLAGLFIAAALCACTPVEGDEQELRQARFLADDAPRPPADAAPWKAQALPDDWSESRAGRDGFAWYRFEVALPAPATRDHAFYLTATLSNSQLFVNGVLAGQSGELQGIPPGRWEPVQLFVVPAGLLAAGDNRLDLRIFVPRGRDGGIGIALFGPYEPLYARQLRDEFGHAIGPAAASLTTLALGFFVLILWLRIRSDREYFIFAVGTILWGLHTAATLMPRDLLPPPHFAVWWNVAYVLWVVMLCVFCVRFARAKWPRYEKGVFAYAAAAVPVLYAAAAVDLLHPVAAVLRLGAIGAALGALYAVIGNALRQRDALSWILLATGAGAAYFGIHDWLAAQDPANLRPMYLVPYLALFFLTLVGWIMIDRFVKTLRQYEALNAELEQRVAEKSRALAIEVELQAEARRDAENANIAKSRFLAAASHDLRQPLHALGLFASALNQRTQDAESRELTGRINQSIEALESLFSEVLDVSRLDAGAVGVNLQAVQLQPLFDRIANDLSSAAEEKNLALRFVPTARLVRSDPVLLERILRNLVANAIRYTEAGGILVGLRPRAGRLVLEVRDAGIGIAAEHQARVFDEFYQVGNVERDRRQGLGLGLSIVKRLCDLLGHGLELASAPGRGTVVRIALEAAQAEPANDEVFAVPVIANSLKGARIVVIDDEVDVRDSMLALLGSWGCEAAAFPTAEEALAAGRGGAPPPRRGVV
jgi:signal transduction histidine kinase